MIIKSERPIAVFDVDGVIVDNPPEACVGQTITDPNFWHNHWSNPGHAKLNREMCDLGQTLMGAGWHIIFLTARPTAYRIDTMSLLARAGFVISNIDILYKDSTMPKLIMLSSIDIPSTSAQWKQDQIRALIAAGGRVQFMVEDYKPNADAVRAVVPVLLYERKKFISMQCCGGWSECRCVDPKVTIVTSGAAGD